MKGCELCRSAARMYCESDQASLCWDCDAKVHGANFLVARHCRTLLCHSCQAATPWTASGAKLGPTVSVCERCMLRHGGGRRGAKNAPPDAQSERSSHNSGGDEEIDAEEEESSGGSTDSAAEEDEDDDIEEDDDDDEEEEEEEEEEEMENQVVPLACMPAMPPRPPPASSSSSEESSTSSRRFNGERDDSEPSLVRLKRPRASVSNLELQNEAVRSAEGENTSVDSLTLRRPPKDQRRAGSYTPAGSRPSVFFASLRRENGGGANLAADYGANQAVGVSSVSD